MQLFVCSFAKGRCATKSGQASVRLVRRGRRTGAMPDSTRACPRIASVPAGLQARLKLTRRTTAGRTATHRTLGSTRCCCRSGRSRSRCRCRRRSGRPCSCCSLVRVLSKPSGCRVCFLLNCKYTIIQIPVIFNTLLSPSLPSHPPQLHTPHVQHLSQSPGWSDIPASPRKCWKSSYTLRCSGCLHVSISKSQCPRSQSPHSLVAKCVVTSV